MIIVPLLVSSGLVVGCQKKAPTTTTGGSFTPDSSPAKAITIDHPVLGEFETENNPKRHQIRQRQERFPTDRRPPFYKGPVPLTYVEVLSPNPGPLSSDQYFIASWKIHGFTTTFSYADRRVGHAGVAGGARVKNEAVAIVAEAKFLEFKGDHILIEEFHYSVEGSVRFHCHSRIEMEGGLSGYKTSESMAEGRKLDEFFFMWPIGAR